MTNKQDINNTPEPDAGEYITVLMGYFRPANDEKDVTTTLLLQRFATRSSVWIPVLVSVPNMSITPCFPQVSSMAAVPDP